MIDRHAASFALLAVILTLLSLPGRALAQGSLADYERAAGLAARTAHELPGAVGELHWVGEGDRLWYRQALAEGKQRYLLVDCKSGRKAPLFDHAVVARALGEITGRKADPERLPIRLIALKGQTVYLLPNQGVEACAFNLVTRKARSMPLREVKPFQLVPEQRVRESRGGGGDTAVIFVNSLDLPLDIFWVRAGGNRVPYGTVAPGKVKPQPTIARHAWVLVDPEGTDRAAFVAQRKPGVALVGPATPAPAEADERRPGIGRPEDRAGKRVSIRNHNVWLLEPGEDAPVPLTTDGTREDGYGGRVKLSPDGTRVVVLRTKAGEERSVHIVESAPRDQVQPKLHSYPYRKPGDRIPVSRPHLFDLEKQREIPLDDELFRTPWSIGDVRWAPDGSRFTFRYNQRGHQVLRIVAVDAHTGEARAIVNEASETFVDYSQKQFVRYLDDTDELIWATERDGFNHLYLYDQKRGLVKNRITRGNWLVRRVDRVDAKGRRVWLQVMGIFPDQDPYHVHHCRIDFDGQDLVHLTSGDGTHSLEFAPDRRTYVDTWSRVDLAPISELRRSEDGSLICELGRGDVTALVKAGWRPPERFVAKGRDGKTDIWGIIRRPTNHDPADRYPVIESIYAGPHGHHVPKRFHRHAVQDELAELGFIVVQIDGMGTNWRSKAFHDVCYQNLGDSGFPDRIRWIRAAAERDPSMDISRVGIYGGSAGGQSALRALLTHGDFYGAAAADCGCHDNRMDKIWWNEAWMGWPIGPHYAEQSNVTQAHRLQGKLLLTVGELDRNVDPASTMQVVDALIRADKDFELVVVPGGGHGVGESRYGRRRRRDFFVRNLLGVEPRWVGESPQR